MTKNTNLLYTICSPTPTNTNLLLRRSLIEPITQTLGYNLAMDVQQTKAKNQPNKKKHKIQVAFVGGLPSFVESLRSVNQSSPEASQNETSISDGLGGRITLGEGEEDIIKK